MSIFKIIKNGTTKWAIDPTHSEIQFKVNHLMISTVTGQFNHFEGNIETEAENFATAKALLTADVNSISTNNEQGDAHLKNNDFFDVENHPQLIFETEKVEVKLLANAQFVKQAVAEPATL